MTEITLYDEGPMNTLAIVEELRAAGYVQRRDFEFVYYPAWWNPNTDVWNPRRAVFTFTDDHIATWFALKYGNNRDD